MISECSHDLLESALAGHLPPDDESSLHRHLEECDDCSAALEQLAGGATWSREAAVLLTADDFDDAASTRDDWSEVDFSVEHLEPADDPSALGRLGSYDVLEIIGRGGMGVVLKGYDRELKRCVAIKALAPHLAHSSLAKKRFIREARAAAAIVHPNVLAIHQVQSNARLPFLVMPLVAGESLAQRLKAQGTLELKEILRIGMQAAAGLAAAHEQGLVHRDVKPANILLEKGVERAVLTDFGLARAADDVSITRLGIIAGTPQYMSPEQARGEPLDGRSDLFSLGCVLYELATGVSPFRADSAMATMRRLVDEAPQALASLNPELPPWFCGIVNRLLEKDPARRFGSAKEVSELLEGCLAHLQQPSVPLPAAAIVPQSRRWPRSLRLTGVLVMMATLAFGMFGLFQLVTADPPDIAGEWTGPEWGNVVLKKITDKEYAGTYTDTFGRKPGEIALKWSRIEQRFVGTWKEGDDRFGDISVRLVGAEIRGAHTTDPTSKINPGTPRLADLAWTRAHAPGRPGAGDFVHRVPFEIGATLLQNGDQINIEEVRGTATTIKAGNMYEVKGTYRLASQPKATLSVYITEDGEAKTGRFKATGPLVLPSDPLARMFERIPTLEGQLMPVERGEGRFRLVFHMSYDGKPHVSFYGEKEAGFAHVYFGTGDSVLKNGWWKAAEKGQTSKMQGMYADYAAALKGQSAVFGPILEREVKDLIDLDTGKLATLPDFKANDANEAIAAGTTWLQQQGMDAAFVGGALFAFGMKVAALDNADWDHFNPQQVAKKIDAIDPAAAPKVKLKHGGTYAFQTREHGQGLLQVLGFTDDALSGQKVRYKLISRKPAPKIERTVADPHHFGPKASFRDCLVCHLPINQSDNTPSSDRPKILVARFSLFEGLTVARPDEVKVRFVEDSEMAEYLKNKDKYIPPDPESAVRRVLARNVAADQPLLKEYFVSGAPAGAPAASVTGKEAVAPNPPLKFMKGVVDRVDEKDKSLVSVSLGTDHGLKVGNTLEVYRLTPEPRYIGVVRIEDVLQRTSVARVVRLLPGKELQDVRAGDQVASSITPADKKTADTEAPRVTLSATKEDIERLKFLIKNAPVTTSYLAELFELTPGSKSEYRFRSDVMTYPILPAEKSAMSFIPMGKVLYLPAGKKFYIQWDGIGASTLHYYGPFYGDPAVKLGLKAQPGEAEPRVPPAARKVFRYQPKAGVLSVAYSHDGAILAVGGEEGTVVLLDAKAGALVRELKFFSKEEEEVLKNANQPDEGVRALAFSPDSSIVAVGHSIGQVKLFNAQTGAVLLSLDATDTVKQEDRKSKLFALRRANGNCWSIAFSPDGKTLATCGDPITRDITLERGLRSPRNAVLLWDVKTGAIKQRNEGHRGQITDVAFSPDGKLVASAGLSIGANENGGILIADAATGKLLRSIAMPNALSVAFSPDGKRLAVGRMVNRGGDVTSGAISLVELPSGVLFQEWPVPVAVRPLAFSADGKAVVSSSAKNGVTLWDASGKAIRTIGPGDNRGRWDDFALSPRGNALAVGGVDADGRGVVEVWDLGGAATDARPAP
jgi:WD40 repeat protein